MIQWNESWPSVILTANKSCRPDSMTSYWRATKGRSDLDQSVRKGSVRTNSMQHVEAKQTMTYCYDGRKSDRENGGAPSDAERRQKVDLTYT